MLNNPVDIAIEDKTNARDSSEVTDGVLSVSVDIGSLPDQSLADAANMNESEVDVQ